MQQFKYYSVHCASQKTRGAIDNRLPGLFTYAPVP
ncbi:hypothetical protein ACVINI_000788 [Rhizobium beringeri]|jgi:hypothetical protein